MCVKRNKLVKKGNKPDELNACYSVGIKKGVPKDSFVVSFELLLLDLQAVSVEYLAVRQGDVENAVNEHFLCLVRFKADILNSGRITGRLYG